MNSSKKKRFLIIRFSAIGDILLTTPLVRSLRKQYPDAEINFLLKKQYSSLLKNSPLINTVLEYDVSKGEHLTNLIKRIEPSSYDGIIDLQKNNRSLLIRLAAKGVKSSRFNHHRLRRFLLVKLGIDLYNKIKPVPLRFFSATRDWGVNDDCAGLEITIEPEAVNSISDQLIKAGLADKGRYIILAPGAGRTTKRWTLTGFAEAGAHFIEQGFKIVLTGGKTDQETCTRLFNMLNKKRTYNLCGHTSLQETAALLQRAFLVITNDTGVMHLSCAVATPVTAIFGPTTKQLGFFPFRARAAVIEMDLKCRPCSYHGSDKCPKGHFRCMKEITSAQVISAAEKLID